MEGSIQQGFEKFSEVLSQELGAIRSEIQGVRSEIAATRNELRVEIAESRAEFHKALGEMNKTIRDQLLKFLHRKPGVKSEGNRSANQANK